MNILLALVIAPLVTLPRDTHSLHTAPYNYILHLLDRIGFCSGRKYGVFHNESRR